MNLHFLFWFAAASVLDAAGSFALQERQSLFRAVVTSMKAREICETRARVRDAYYDSLAEGIFAEVSGPTPCVEAQTETIDQRKNGKVIQLASGVLVTALRTAKRKESAKPKPKRNFCESSDRLMALSSTSAAFFGIYTVALLFVASMKAASSIRYHLARRKVGVVMVSSRSNEEPQAEVPALPWGDSSAATSEMRDRPRGTGTGSAVKTSATSSARTC